MSDRHEEQAREWLRSVQDALESPHGEDCLENGEHCTLIASVADLLRSVAEIARKEALEEKDDA